MSAITACAAAARLAGAEPQSGSNRAQSNSSLLPAPEALPADQMMALVALQSRSRQLNRLYAQRDVKANQKLREAAKARQLEELRKAQRKNKGFWKKLKKVASTVGKVAAVVGSIALAVCTAGAGTAVAVLAIAGVVLSAGSFAQSQFHVLQKFGVSDKAAMWTEIGMALGAAICSGGAAYCDPKNAQTAVQVTQRVANAAGAGAKAAEGGATCQEKQLEADALEHEANAVAEKLSAERLERMILNALECLKAHEKSEERAQGSLRSAIDIRSATLVASALRV